MTFSFTVHSQELDHDFQITWTDGLLSGDDVVLGPLRNELECWRLHNGGFVSLNNITAKSDEQDPMGTLIAARRRFGGTSNEQGDVPVAPAVPDGALA